MPEAVERLRVALAGRYSVGREIGRGGMAVVYLAQDLQHGRPVALKALRPDLAAALGPDRFLREIHIAAGLNHPHILPLHDSGVAEGLLYYVMPYVEGDTLSDRLRKGGPLPIDEAVRIGRDIAAALAYAHGHGVVHRDIKPANVLLTQGEAIVADFGIARAISAAADDSVSEVGLAIGTPMYMSPEQGVGAEADERSDIYSLGCVLYEMLAGTPPFSGDRPRAVLARHLYETPPDLWTLRPSVPRWLHRIVTRSLAKVPADRYTTAAEVTRALEEAGRAGAPAAAAQRFGRPSVTAVTTGVVGGLLLLGLGVLLARSVRTRQSAGVGVVILPLEERAQQPGADSTRAYRLFAEGASGLPWLRVIDGRALNSGAGRTAGSPAELLRGARELGGRYLVIGSAVPAPGGSGGWLVSLELVSVADGSRLSGLDGRTETGDVDDALDRAALAAIRAVADREGLALETGDALLRATVSARALGRLLDGKSRFWAGDYDAAAAALRGALAADPKCGLAYHRLSIAEMWRHDYPAALAAADSGLARGGDLGEGWVGLLRSQRYYLRRQGDSAIAGFQRSLLDNPQNIDGWLGLGEAFFHHGPVTGHPVAEAASAFERVVSLDSTFAPIYDHLFDLAVAGGDARKARSYLTHIRASDPARAPRETALALWFGSPDERRRALQQLEMADRYAISELVALAMGLSSRLGLADTMASYLVRADRPPDDRRRGGEYRLAALAGQGHWAQAAAAWRQVAGDDPFDGWVVQADLAGFPADDLAGPMFAWASRLLAQGRVPDFTRPLTDEPEQAFFGLVHRATLEGDSAGVLALARRIDLAPANPDSTDPSRQILRASLDARLALLARDTTRAIELLELAAARRPEPFIAYFPLAGMAPQRLLVAELSAARGDRRGAQRWLSSFVNSRALGDVIYRSRVRQLEARLSVGRVAANRR